MALIKCPECGKEISDTTPSCPHCGYQLSTVTSTVSPTKIGEVKTSIPAGIVLVLLGVALIYLGCLAAFVLSVFAVSVFPVFCIFGYLVFVCIKSGIQKITGTQDAYCPYCGRVKRISKNKYNFKCRSCKKRSIRAGDYLKPVP